MKRKIGNKFFSERRGFTWRVNMLSIVVTVVFLIIFFKLFQIQVLNHNFYKALAQDQHELFEKTMPERGEIFIKDAYLGEPYPLATNRELNLIYAVPNEITDKKETAAKLSVILGIDEEKVFGIINKENDPYEIVERGVQEKTAEKIRGESISGINISPEMTRYYPENYLAANVVGFIGYSGNEKVGQYGIEGYYDERLKGVSGFLEIEKDTSGSWITFGSKNSQEPRDGDDILLTIDRTIQYISEQKIKNAVIKYGAENGNLIVMDPKSGAILAIAQYPGYNPNEYFKEENMNVFLNASIHGVYEPGSIQKPITMAIGIDSGNVNTGLTYIDDGAVRIDGWVIRNSDGKANGKQNMVQILEKSLNTGSVFVQQQVEKEEFYNYLKAFGLDEITGIEIKGEAKGNLSNLNEKKDINYATASYGQGISVTPLAMLMAISAFANDGKLMKPHVVSEFIGPDGSIEKKEPKVIRQVISPKTASLISAMMVSVIENGHSKLARVEGYKLAGKTGTAQVPKKEGRGYETGKIIHTFVGFGPVPDAKFSVLIKLDNPKNAIYAANTTAPVFSEIARELINYYNIPAS